jgi:hypothetical protein
MKNNEAAKMKNNTLNWSMANSKESLPLFKYWYLIPVLAVLFSAFTVINEAVPLREVNNESFSEGERLEFKVHVGPINAAYSTMAISDTVYQINGRPCYKISIEGNTTGFFDMFVRVRDVWGTYLDTQAILPQRFYRNIQENKYRKYEIVDFDHKNKKAIVTKLDKETKRPTETKPFDISENSQDLVSGYYFLRTLEYKNKKEGEIISIPAFFDNEKYNFDVRFVGREEVRTKIGKINALVLSPIMPSNSLFDGENAIQVWLSDDKNKIPIKIKAKMFVGSVEIDLLEAKNIKSPINYSK